MPDEDRVAETLGDFCDRCERGEALTPEKVISAHPELSAELREGFAALDLVDLSLSSPSGENWRTDAGRDMRPGAWRGSLSEGRLDEGCKCCERQLTLAIGMDDSWSEIAASHDLGVAFFYEGRLREARTQHTKCLDLARERGTGCKKAVPCSGWPFWRTSSLKLFFPNCRAPIEFTSIEDVRMPLSG